MELPSKTDSQEWKRLYEAAMLELNSELLYRKIEEAQQAITQRALTLSQGPGDRLEQQALANAHLALEDLKRIYPAVDKSA
jgi:hypothetical protein